MDPAVYAIERREQARNWWFRGRRRILHDLLARVGLPFPARLLDFGCGTGANGSVLRRFGTTIGVDLSPHALGGETQGHHLRLRSDVSRLPLASGSFDGAIALDVLEHLDDDAAGANELLRVLRPGAPAIVFVPAFRTLWGGQDVVSHHRRRYERDQIVHLLERTGFGVERATYFNTILFMPIYAVRRALWSAGVTLASENELTGRLTNELLAALFALEAPVLRRMNLPFGVSIACVARRPNPS